MDKQWLIGWVGAVCILVTLVVGICVGLKVDYDAQIRFAEICVNSGKNVEYRDVGGNLVSECK